MGVCMKTVKTYKKDSIFSFRLLVCQRRWQWSRAAIEIRRARGREKKSLWYPINFVIFPQVILCLRHCYFSTGDGITLTKKEFFFSCFDSHFSNSWHVSPANLIQKNIRMSFPCCCWKRLRAIQILCVHSWMRRQRSTAAAASLMPAR